MANKEKYIPPSDEIRQNEPEGLQSPALSVLSVESEKTFLFHLPVREFNRNRHNQEANTPDIQEQLTTTKTEIKIREEEKEPETVFSNTAKEIKEFFAKHRREATMALSTSLLATSLACQGSEFLAQAIKFTFSSSVRGGIAKGALGGIMLAAAFKILGKGIEKIIAGKSRWEQLYGALLTSSLPLAGGILGYLCPPLGTGIFLLTPLAAGIALRRSVHKKLQRKIHRSF